MSRRNGAHAEGRRRGLVRLAGLAYPGWWRDRYGPEQARLAEDLLAEGRSALKLAVSLVAGGALAFAGARSAERCRRVADELAPAP